MKNKTKRSNLYLVKLLSFSYFLRNFPDTNESKKDATIRYRESFILTIYTIETKRVNKSVLNFKRLYIAEKKEKKKNPNVGIFRMKSEGAFLSF